MNYKDNYENVVKEEALEPIKSRRAKFMKWCKVYITSEKNKANLEKFFEYLDDSDFYIAPASTRFHSNVDGGLCEHTMKVISRMFKICNAEYSEEESKTPEYKEKVFLVAALHDLCKVNFYHRTERYKKDENNEWYTYPFWEIEDELPMGHGEKSLYIAQRFFDLTDEQAIAIRWHMGFSDSSVKGGCLDIGEAYSKYPIALYLNMADSMATFLDETTTKY